MHGGEWEPIVVVPAEGSLADALRETGATVVAVDLGVLRHRAEARSPVLVLRLVTAFAAVRSLTRIIRRYDVAVVHSNAAGVIAGALAARRAKIPHVWHVREILSGPAWPPLRRAMFALSARIVCISDCVADHVTRGQPRQGVVTVIRDGIDVSLFAPPAHRRSTGEVLMLSRVHPDKGHKEFLRAAALVAEHQPAAHFSLVGGCIPAYEDLRSELEAMIVDLGLAGRAELLPAVTRAEAAEALRGADVAVVPSTWAEPGGLVVLEAMASGTPVIATDRGGPAEVVTDGVDGFLVSPVATDRLAATIEKLLSDEHLRERIGRRSRQRLVDAFGLDSEVDRLVELYEELASPGRIPCV